jgi:hypothetical protein
MVPAVLIATELAFLVLAAVQIVRVWRQFKRNRADAGDFWAALEEAVGQQVGPIAARLIVSEPKLWTAIFLWISRPSGIESVAFRSAVLESPYGQLVVRSVAAPIESDNVGLALASSHPVENEV